MDSIPASPRVLVVDDDPDVLASLERGLRLSGFEVFTAVDGAEALRSATETRPDAIVLDINMPIMDGMEACSRIDQYYKTGKVIDPSAALEMLIRRSS
jgi:two-component system response regulator PrrA